VKRIRPTLGASTDMTVRESFAAWAESVSNHATVGRNRFTGLLWVWGGRREG